MPPDDPELRWVARLDLDPNSSFLGRTLIVALTGIGKDDGKVPSLYLRHPGQLIIPGKMNQPAQD
jgi:hypothetical protein